MWGSREAGSPTSPGCWNFSSEKATTGFDISLDTSTWTNGSHTIKIEATPSTGSVHSTSVTVTTTNDLPSVEWVSQSEQTVIDHTTLTVKFRPGGVPRIVKACLSRDGAPVVSADNFYFEGDTSYGNFPSNPGPDGRFGSAPGGCAVFSEFQNNQYPAGLHQLTSMTIGVSTVSWADQPTTLMFSMIDAADRIFSTPITVNVLNSRPKTVLSGLDNATVWEDVQLNQLYSRSGSDLSRICINGASINDQNMTIYHDAINGLSGIVSPINGCWTSSPVLTSINFQTAKIRLNTQLMSNGNHSLTVTSTDVLGKSDTSTHSFTVSNGSPIVKISTPVSGSQLNNWIVLTAESSMPAYMRSTSIKQTCVSLADSNFCSNSSSGFLSTDFNSSCLPNGSFTISAATLDTAEKTGSNVTSIVIRNGQPRTHSVKIKSNSPAWNSKHISGRISLKASSACSYRIELFDAKGKRTAERISGDFQSKSQYEAELFFTRLKPASKYKVRITLTNSRGSATRMQSFSTPALPPRPKVNLIAKICREGTNLDTCIGRLRAYPSVVDCTFVRRNWIWNTTSWWIIGYLSGSAVISRTPFICT
jgi:hypothetical protein